MEKIAEDLLHIFVTGGAGVGKSHPVRVIYQSLEKILRLNSDNLENERVFLLAQTGVAAANINETKMNSALAIPKKTNAFQINQLSDKVPSTLRDKYDEVKVLIIDEISMVSNSKFLDIHQRFVDIFGSSTT